MSRTSVLLIPMENENHSNAADGYKSLVFSSKLTASADLSRYAAWVIGEGSALKLIM
jgi:hypothetical protein